MPLKDPEQRRAYQREYMRTRWYPTNRARHGVAVRRSSKQRLALIRETIDRAKDRPCADCGGRFPLVAMDFDHVGGDKRFNLANARWRELATLATVESEIAKCDVVCANCHRVRTWRRLSSIVSTAG